MPGVRLRPRLVQQIASASKPGLGCAYWRLSADAPVSIRPARSSMKIAVMGSGGLGGYFGARLASGGADVAFIARGAHLAAMQERGIAVEGPEPIHVPRVTA